MSRFVVVVAAAAALSSIGCEKKKEGGLPPAEKWQGGGGGGDTAAKPGADDPHAGMNMGGGGDPHAGMNMGGGGDPHAGMDMGGGGAPSTGPGGLPPPDPNRPIDPNKYVRGTIKTTAKTKALVKAGGAIFLTAKRPDASGNPSGAPLAVAKLEMDATGAMAFELTEANQMIAGTDFSGEVIVTARFDQDGDAISKQSGDVSGQVKATIPADKLELVLDTVLP